MPAARQRVPAHPSFPADSALGQHWARLPPAWACRSLLKAGRSPFSRGTAVAARTSGGYSEPTWERGLSAASASLRPLPPAACEGPLLPVATATLRAKNSARLAESFRHRLGFLFFSVIYICMCVYTCMYIPTYICVYFLVKHCCSFFYIFAIILKLVEIWREWSFHSRKVPISLRRHLSFKPRQKEPNATPCNPMSWGQFRDGTLESKAIQNHWCWQLLSGNNPLTFQIFRGGTFGPRHLSYCQTMKAFQ